MILRWSYLAALSSTFSVSMMAECPPPISASQIEIYPSAKSVPANLLRFYLYFPRPMGRQTLDSDIRLVSPDGREVSQAFLPMRYDLWSSDRRRVTLILDPGRVKTGLASHNTHGRALIVGEDFELQVSQTLRDSNGCDLGADMFFSYSVRAAELTPILPQSWSIKIPDSGTKTPLKLDLGHPHDHLSMAYRIRVHAENGEPIGGQIKLFENERIWTFVPRENWSASPYKIVIDDRLEDLAGNRPGVAFDRNVEAPGQSWARELTFVPQP